MRQLWTQTVVPPVRGVRLARESETVLVWDGRDDLYLFNRAGKLQAQRPSPMAISVAGCAEDGSAFVVGGFPRALVCWLAPDLSPRWQRPLPREVTALAVEPLGRCVAVADASSALHLIDARGRTLWQAATPRPLQHLAFVPEKPILVGAADFGLVVCFGAAGECLWRDGLVAHIGSIAVNGDGDCILLACFSEGLVRYRAADSQQQRIPLDSACHYAAVSYAGDVLLTAETTHHVSLRDAQGVPRDRSHLESPIKAAVLGALADYAVVGLTNGLVLRFETV